MFSKIKFRHFTNDTGCTLNFLDEDNAKKLAKKGDYSQINLYYVSNIIAEALQIPHPYIGTATMYRESATREIGHTYYSTDHPDQLDKDLVLLDVAIHPYLIFGTMCHELRHSWQRLYHPEEYAFLAVGETESYLAPAEIDADGFAIAVLSLIYKEPVKDAAEVFCCNVKHNSQKGYSKRISAANSIKRSLEVADFEDLIISVEKNAK